MMRVLFQNGLGFGAVHSHCTDTLSIMSLFNSPLSAAKADQLIAVLGIEKNSRILDAGCGTGEFLIRAVNASGGTGLGIDIDQKSIDLAQENASKHNGGGTTEFRVGDIQDPSLGDLEFDIAICMGSTHAFGSGVEGYPNALFALSRLLRPGGLMLIGEGYWKQPPAAEYLKFLGEPAGVYRDHFENITLAEAHGFLPMYAAVSSDDEWDHFEWSHYRRAIQRAEACVDAADTAKGLERSIAWRNGYLRWGRTTMGFGLYLFRTPTKAD
jgi:cyclopropane fatty-acyl-phospholipid synthase-like methyltransferase